MNVTVLIHKSEQINQKHQRTKEQITTTTTTNKIIIIIIIINIIIIIIIIIYTYSTCNLDHWPLKTIPLLWYPKVILYIKFDHFGIICFWVMLRADRQTDKQTHRQTDGLECPTHADRQSQCG